MLTMLNTIFIIFALSVFPFLTCVEKEGQAWDYITKHILQLNHTKDDKSISSLNLTPTEISNFYVKFATNLENSTSNGSCKNWNYNFLVRVLTQLEHETGSKHEAIAEVIGKV